MPTEVRIEQGRPASSFVEVLAVLLFIIGVAAFVVPPIIIAVSDPQVASQPEVSQFDLLKGKIAQCSITDAQIRAKTDYNDTFNMLHFQLAAVNTGREVDQAKRVLAQAKLDGIGLEKAQQDLREALQKDTEAVRERDCNGALVDAHGLALDAMKAGKPMPNFFD
jgi:hypothetical protein